MLRLPKCAPMGHDYDQLSIHLQSIATPRFYYATNADAHDVVGGHHLPGAGLLLAAISFTARDAKRTAAPPCAWRVGAVSSRGQATPG